MNSQSKSNWTWLLFVVVSAGCTNHGRNGGIELISKVRRVSDADVRKVENVHLAGDVTFVSPFGDSCFIQDVTGGAKIVLLPGQQKPLLADRLEVTGVLQRSGSAPLIANARIVKIQPHSIPAARPYGVWTFANPPEFNRVVLSATVTDVTQDNVTYRILHLRKGNVKVTARVTGLDKDYDTLPDSEVTVTGVLSTNFDVNGKARDYNLDVATLDDFAVSKRAVPPDSLRALIPTEVVQSEKKPLPEHRVRVAGVVARTDRGTFLSDSTGRLKTDWAGPDGPADIAGFLRIQDGHLFLSHAIASVPEVYDAPERLIRTAHAIHMLSPGEAGRRQSVEVRGVITYCEPNSNCFVEDATGGVYITGDRGGNEASAGDSVIVRGVTAAGDFAPVITKASFQKLGRAPMPPDTEVNREQTFMGGDDSHWVTMQGVVQSVTPDTLNIWWAEHHFMVHLPAPVADLQNLVDSTVLIRGVCGTLFNTRRQLLGVQVFVPGKNFLTIIDRGTPDGFTLPVRSAGSLFNFSDARGTGHRVHLQGTVTLKSGANLFWIRDASGGVRVRCNKLENVTAGDRVDVIGFPAAGGLSPMIEGADLRIAGHETKPSARWVTPSEAASGKFDSELVEIDAKLLDTVLQEGEQSLVLQSGNNIFNARLADAHDSELPEPGTLLRLTGICSVVTDASTGIIVPKGFDLVLGSFNDLQILRKAAWWNSSRLQLLVLGTLLVIAAAISWALLLRRQVVAQTAKLTRKAEQLEEAKNDVESALHRARTAESLEQQKKRILELIARDEPLKHVLLEMASAIEKHSGGACSIQLGTHNGERLDATPTMSADWRETMETLPVPALRVGARYRPVKEFSSDPRWLAFLAMQNNVPQTVFASAVMVNSRRVGVICIFYKDRHQVTDFEAGLVASWCGFVAMAYERRSLYDQLSHRAKHDELTGLPNRVLLFERLNAEIATASCDGSTMGILYIDLDGFKGINDGLGHAAGDMVLQNAAQRMSASVRRGDTVARVGGDEFVILLPRLNCRLDAEVIAEKIAAAVELPMYSDHLELHLGASIGISVYPDDGVDPAVLLRSADEEMYRHKAAIKRQGRREQTLHLSAV